MLAKKADKAKEIDKALFDFDEDINDLEAVMDRYPTALAGLPKAVIGARKPPPAPKPKEPVSRPVPPVKAVEGTPEAHTSYLPVASTSLKNL